MYALGSKRALQTTTGVCETDQCFELTEPDSLPSELMKCIEQDYKTHRMQIKHAASEMNHVLFLTDC